MKKNYFFATIFGLFLTSSFAQFTKNDVQYWVGSGSDSAVVVIDFNDNSSTPSQAWGFLFDDATYATITDVLTTLDTDVNSFSINLAFGFLNDINYDTHMGVGGTNGYYWGTYTGTSSMDFSMNGGIGDTLVPGNWYGFNFTDWNPNPPYDALQDLSNPVAALNPSAIITENLMTKLDVYKSNSKLIVKGFEGNLSIIDLSGKLFYETTHHTYSVIDCSDFDSGLYLITVQTKNGLVTRKVQF